MLLRHGAAFILYLVSAVAVALGFGFYSFFPKNKAAVNIFTATMIFYLICSFVSQVLLCNIFYVLGKKIDAEPAEASTTVSRNTLQDEDEVVEEYADVVVKPWDTEASLQASMWNQFVRT